MSVPRIEATRDRKDFLENGTLRNLSRERPDGVALAASLQLGAQALGREFRCREKKALAANFEADPSCARSRSCILVHNEGNHTHSHLTRQSNNTAAHGAHGQLGTA